MKTMHTTTAAFFALFLMAGTFWAPSAEACGGFFCQVTPVDQNAERILFVVNPDDTITAHVEISYTGAADAFSWVVPVPDTPTLDVVPPSVLQLLARASTPRIIAPPTTCNTANDAFRGVAVADDAEASGGGNGGVIVEQLPQVGPFDPIVVSGTDAAELITWLNDNQYVITPEMEPFIEDYVTAGMKFLAMKLAPDAEVADISPIKMTYPGTEPMVPLVLTAVAAEPEMGIIVLIAGQERFASKNWANMEVDTDQVQMDPRTGQTNYWALVSMLIDEEGGRAFITERSTASSSYDDDVAQVFLGTEDEEEARNYLADLFLAHPHITRFYARMSGWEMTEDPVFEAVGGDDVSGVHDLSDRPEVEVCGDAPAVRTPCGSTFCGLNALCATTESEVDGCVCPSGFVGRAIADPSASGGQGRTVACQQTDFDMLQSMEDEGGFRDDFCGETNCGNGECVLVGGFPTCLCDDGFAAVPTGDEITCSKVIETFKPEQLLWPDFPRGAGCGCRTGPQSSPWDLTWIGLGVGAWVLSRRRRRK
jgi:MYXO-CTERM domain-containing protein